jgi:hypothetical protein
MPDETNLTKIYGVVIDLHLDVAGLNETLEALGVPPSGTLLDEPGSPRGGRDPEWERRLLQWGWGTDRFGDDTKRVVAIGCYGDWLWEEEVNLFLPVASSHIRSFGEFVYSHDDRYPPSPRETLYGWRLNAQARMARYRVVMDLDFAFGDAAPLDDGSGS